MGRPAEAGLALLITLLSGATSAWGQVPDTGPPTVAQREELARHQGWWQVETFEREGGGTSDAARLIVRKVEGSRVVWMREGRPFAGTYVSLDADRSPAWIDVRPEGGRSRGEVARGIYRLEGDRLTVCMADPGGARPESFEAPKGSGRTRMTFQRVEAPKRERREGPASPP